MMFAMARVGLKVRNHNAKSVMISRTVCEMTQVTQRLLESMRSAMGTTREKRQNGGAPAWKTSTYGRCIWSIGVNLRTCVTRVELKCASQRQRWT